MNEVLNVILSNAPTILFFLCFFGFDKYKKHKKIKERRLLEEKRDALDASAYQRVAQTLSTALRTRGFELHHEGGRVVGRDGGTRIDFGHATEDPDAVFSVRLEWDTTARTMSMSWETSKAGSADVELQTETWRATFSLRDVMSQQLVTDQLKHWAELGVRRGDVREGRSSLLCVPKVRHLEVRPEVFLEHLLAQRSRLGMWTSRPLRASMLDLEEIVPRQPSQTVASYYQEVRAQGILSPAEVFARVAKYANRSFEPFSVLMAEPPTDEVLQELGLERTLRLHELLQKHDPWSDVSRRLSRSIATHMEPEQLIEHADLSADGALEIVRQWRSDMNGPRIIDDCARIDATLAAMWPDRPAPWRVGILGGRVSSFAVHHTDPEPHRVIEAAALHGRTLEEHIALGLVLRLVRADVLEREDVIDALITQIERAPPGSNGAIVDVLLLRNAQNIRRVLLRRMRGVDPLSPLIEAAQRLCDPERLRGALTASEAGGEGGLSVVVSERGGITEATPRTEEA